MISKNVQTPLDHLISLYGEGTGRSTYDAYCEIIDGYRSRLPPPHQTQLSQKDAILITYGDQVRLGNVAPLRSLADFCAQYLQGVISGVHILPFYPYSSDDGFSVMDYRQVDTVLGGWGDVERLGQHFNLMFDAVINHISAESEWFQGFLKDQYPYRDYFIVVEGEPDLSQVVRPRALPLLNTYPTVIGEKKVWTTFSADQIDLNYHNPGVMIAVLDTLLYYVLRGADFIRLDAIAYLWKEIGTTCIHLPQTHYCVQLMRATLESVAPHVQIITETNVPHEENISYFGDGTNEAGLVYNFALPPLVLHTLGTGDSTAISRWASGLSLPTEKVTFFNFLASHDGIGITPAIGLISPEEIQALVKRTQRHGGLVSYRSNPDGTQSPYELNINYFDALSDPNTDEPLQIQVDRFIAAHSIMLSLVGVPGIYFHSMFGSRGWQEGFAQTGRNRTINRQKLNRVELEDELADPDSLRFAVFTRLAHMLRARASHPAFHPHGEQQVLELDNHVFSVMRSSPDGREHALCLQNISYQVVEIVPDQVGIAYGIDTTLFNLLTHAQITEEATHILKFAPYQAIWLGARPTSISRET